MNDTNPKVESIFQEMIMKKTPEQRVKMGFSMFDMARKQVIASIKISNPNADDKEIKREIFLRFYGEDFLPEEREKILMRLLSYHY